MEAGTGTIGTVEEGTVDYLAGVGTNSVLGMDSEEPVNRVAAPDQAVEGDTPAVEEEILDSWSVEGMLFVGASPPYPEAP